MDAKDIIPGFWYAIKREDDDIVQAQIVSVTRRPRDHPMGDTFQTAGRERPYSCEAALSLWNNYTPNLTEAEALRLILAEITVDSVYGKVYKIIRRVPSWKGLVL